MESYLLEAEAYLLGLESYLPEVESYQPEVEGYLPAVEKTSILIRRQYKWQPIFYRKTTLVLMTGS